MSENIAPIGMRISNCTAGAPCGFGRAHGHYQNTTLSATTATIAHAPNSAGCSNQRTPWLSMRGVSEYTSPARVFRSGGAVARLIRMVTMKHADQAKIAVQKFCAISLG